LEQLLLPRLHVEDSLRYLRVNRDPRKHDWEEDLKVRWCLHVRKAKAIALTAERAADAVEAGVGRFLEGVLPDVDDFPSLTAELAVDTLIAGHVARAFFYPRRRGWFWVACSTWGRRAKNIRRRR
jgi:hypothetical protein